MQITPRSRTTELLIEELENELLVYDLAADRAHRLNATAATVFRHADGTRTVADLVEVLGEQADVDADEDLVLITLDGLVEAGLIEDYTQRPTEDARASRRRFIRRVGAVGAAAAALPVVHSIVAPTAAQAQSPCCPDGISFYGCCYGPEEAGELFRRFSERQARQSGREAP